MGGEIRAVAGVFPMIFPASPVGFPSGAKGGPERKAIEEEGRIVFPLGNVTDSSDRLSDPEGGKTFPEG